MTQDNGTAIARRAPIEEREVTYAPFQSQTPITLTAGMVIKFLCKPTKRGFTCSAEHAVRFMMLCKARSLNPWEGDAYLVGYDGQDGPEFNLITAHQAFLKRAEAHKNFDGMESGVILEDGDGVMSEVQGDFIVRGLQLVGGWAKVYRSDRKFPTYRRLNLATFNKGYSQWKANPAGMIVKCAEADALRSSFPNSMAGMMIDAEQIGPSTIVESRSAAEESRMDRLNRQIQERVITAHPPSEGQTLEPADDARQPGDSFGPAASAVAVNAEEDRATPQVAETPQTAPEAPAPPRESQKPAPEEAKAEPVVEKATDAPAIVNPTHILSDSKLIECMGAVAQAADIPEKVMMEWLGSAVVGDRKNITGKRRMEVYKLWKKEVAGMKA